MAHSGTKITAPVQILGDLQPVLGTGLDGLGNIIAGQTGGQYKVEIKEWAKYKPVRHASRSALTEAQRAVAKYGLSAPSTPTATTAPYALFSYYDGNMNGWTYQRPRGYNPPSYEEWFRLLDFDGYNHAPSDPIRSYSAATEMQCDTQPATFQMAGFIGVIDSTGSSIGLGEIAKILSANPSVTVEPLYFGVALFKGTGVPTASSACEIATNPSPISINSQQGDYQGTTVSFTKVNNAAAKGDWVAIPFLCSQAISQRGAWEGTSLPSVKFYTLPLAGITSLRIYDSSGTYTMAFVGTKTALALNAKITITNKRSTAHTYAINMYYWDPTISGTPDTRQPQSPEKVVSTSLTVPANSSADWVLPVYGPGVIFVGKAVAYVRVGADPLVGPLSFRKEEL